MHNGLSIIIIKKKSLFTNRRKYKLNIKGKGKRQKLALILSIQINVNILNRRLYKLGFNFFHSSFHFGGIKSLCWSNSTDALDSQERKEGNGREKNVASC